MMAKASVTKLVQPAERATAQRDPGPCLVVDLADFRAFGQALKLRDAIRRTLDVAHYRAAHAQDGGEAA
jgi:hypothetical protein